MCNDDEVQSMCEQIRQDLLASAGSVGCLKFWQGLDGAKKAAMCDRLIRLTAKVVMCSSGKESTDLT
jgi:hypothetical protein